MKFLQTISIWRSLTKWQIKVLLATFAFVMMVSVLLYTQQLANELIQREQRIVTFYADIYKHYLSDVNKNADDFLFLLDRIVPSISFPVIFTDAKGNPNRPFSEYTLNVDIDTSLAPDRLKVQEQKLVDLLKTMGETYPPILIKDADGMMLGKIYYTNSALIRQMQLLPYIEIIIVSAFVLIGYIAFSYVRRTEESNVWVGMAKEAAHQLGTPLSSLLGWLEILRLNNDNPSSVQETAKEMENDLHRLNTIANRFSKIGSEPTKRRENISEIVEKVCSYLEKRVPHLGKKVSIERNLEDDIHVLANGELLEWVFENVLKNGVESIEAQSGLITVTLSKLTKGKVIITLKDNGKGMSGQVRRRIFEPGFTTKKRGWGLGLSLSKRIIERYHDGRIFVKESVIGKGTTFVIELPVIA
ncbi:MAG: HAMP domain-containing histidine kinase [Ignavibacteria bacterium]|nr:HAMP domain-containing histidine kinase [Ignavibacteria bacterium]